MTDRSETPQVSVVVASYRWPEALRLALRSALSQTVREIEVIVVEDGRDRRSREVVRELADPRLRWRHLMRNSGSQARPNAEGRRRARAPVVAYLGHDDLWAPDHLELLLAALEREGADIAHSMTVMPGHPIMGTVLAGRFPATDAEHVPPSSIAHLRDSPRVGAWSRDASGTLPVDYEFMARSRALGAEVTATGTPTVLKLPAGWSLETFRSGDASGQQEMSARLAEDPDLLSNLAQEAMAAGSSGEFKHVLPDLGPGEIGAYVRRNKGLPSRFIPRLLTWSAEEPLFYPGWLEAESDGTGAFRRVQPGARAMVRLDAPRWPFFRIEVELVASPGVGPDRVRLDLDGVEIPSRWVGGQSGSLKVEADARLGFVRRPAVIDIGISDESVPSDDATGGLAVRSISLRPRLLPFAQRLRLQPR